jgi:hypothetical protein
LSIQVQQISRKKEKCYEQVKNCQATYQIDILKLKFDLLKPTKQFVKSIAPFITTYMAGLASTDP